MNARVYKYNSYLSIEITERDNTKYVAILSTIHVNKRYMLPHCYSTSFTDKMILGDSDLIKHLLRFF